MTCGHCGKPIVPSNDVFASCLGRLFCNAHCYSLHMIELEREAAAEEEEADDPLFCKHFAWDGSSPRCKLFDRVCRGVCQSYEEE